jgi:N-methylhydantoinase A
MSVIIGVDIGGTFTDVVMHDEASGEIHVVKVPSTPEDFSIGLIQGLEALPVDVSEIGLIVHGTTVATNAVLERKGARCGLIMTKGFRDIIELRRRDRPQTYGLKGQFKPLISRDCRLEVEERTNYRGAVEVEPSELELTEAAKGLLDRDVEVVGCWKKSGPILSSSQVQRFFRKCANSNAQVLPCSMDMSNH